MNNSMLLKIVSERVINKLSSIVRSKHFHTSIILSSDETMKSGEAENTAFPFFNNTTQVNLVKSSINKTKYFIHVNVKFFEGPHTSELINSNGAELEEKLGE